MFMHNMLSGIAIGGTTGFSLLLLDAVTGSTMVNIKEAMAVGVFACVVVLWMGKKFQRIDDRFENIETKLTEMKNGRQSEPNQTPSTKGNR